MHVSTDFSIVSSREIYLQLPFILSPCLKRCKLLIFLLVSSVKIQFSYILLWREKICLRNMAASKSSPLQRRNLWFIWNVFLCEIKFCNSKWNFIWKDELLLIAFNVFSARRSMCNTLSRKNLLKVYWVYDLCSCFLLLILIHRNLIKREEEITHHDFNEHK